MPTLQVGPVTRIEGHLDIEADIGAPGGPVVSARSSGTMFRGFEKILVGRDPRDAPHLTQRICGVCPVSHGMAATKALESAAGVPPTNNGRILRNLVLASNFLQSHVLHFYHLAALDYLDVSKALTRGPWAPSYVTPDMLRGDGASVLLGHYVEALSIRRKAHQMGAIFGGKLPCPPTFVPGGCSQQVTSQKIVDFRTLLDDISWFIDNVYLPDVALLAEKFPAWFQIGRGPGNLLAFGVFDLDAAGNAKLLSRGQWKPGDASPGALDPGKITEYVKYSRYTTQSGNLNPAAGVTEPMDSKPGAYSWIKAPRYEDRVYEVGALARMWVNGDYTKGISVMDRHMARALEARKIAAAMRDWLDQLEPGKPTQVSVPTPVKAVGIGLTEAPRGALGHWVEIASGKIARYQVLTPTAWNASPKDDRDSLGAIEQALVGTPVADVRQPIELLRVVHSFDPCLACSVHLGRARRTAS